MPVAASAEGAELDTERGRQLASWSLLMLPLLLLTAALAAFLGMYLLGLRDLEGSEPMSVQGSYGWMVWAVTTGIFLVPAAVGLGLGLQARRHGAGRSGTVGAVLNGVILVGFPLLALFNLLGQ